MNLYLISQDSNLGYDTYDSAVVAAKSPKAAVLIHPTGVDEPNPPEEKDLSGGGTWAPANLVTAEFLGKAKRGTKSGVICASFNAG